MIDLRIEPSGSQEFGPCDCCGGTSRTVWGYANRGADTAAAYFVQWTMGQVDRHGANVDLIIGKWGDGATRSDRCSVALEYRRTDRGPSLMVIDSEGRTVASSNLVGKALARREVLGTPLAQLAFDIVDAIWRQDERIKEIVSAA